MIFITKMLIGLLRPGRLSGFFSQKSLLVNENTKRLFSLIIKWLLRQNPFIEKSATSNQNPKREITITIRW